MTMKIDRRTLLFRGPLAAVAASSLLRVTAAAKTWPQRSPKEFKARLVGPILSNPTPFTSNFEPDYDGLRRIVARAVRHGVPVFASTAGNSQYSSLSYEEVKSVTRVLIDAVDGRGLTIAATGDWWTSRAIDYCRYAESLGADAVQVMLPPRRGGDSEVVAHFEAIARGTKLPIVLHGRYSEPLLTRLAAIDAIVAMKEDLELTYYIDRQIEFGDRFEIFSGGAENRYLVGYPYGSKAFFSVYTTFAPDISMRFWKAVQANDLTAAASITKRYDYRFIKNFSHEFWHATLEYFGLAQRYLRPPQRSFTDDEMTSVKAFFDGQGLHPEDYE